MEQAQRLIDASNVTKKKGVRDRAIFSVMLGCGLRRSDATLLRTDCLQKRSHVWVLANVLGKRNKI
ncbi:tyrosine-type recombinase/integrase [bacterium]|nr:tyrosine-type recombinase/integrase [bacterium]